MEIVWKFSNLELKETRNFDYHHWFSIASILRYFLFTLNQMAHRKRLFLLSLRAFNYGGLLLILWIHYMVSTILFNKTSL